MSFFSVLRVCLGFALALILTIGLTPAFAAAVPDRQDIATMPVSELLSLQQRLKDDGCYSGPIDGTPTQAIKAAVAACPDQRPSLQIETDMHIASIWRVSADAGCHIAATASLDKTVRIWSLPDGQLLRVLRWPIGVDHNGSVFATAISPNGRYVAVGGVGADREVFGTLSIIIFDSATGAVVARINSISKVSFHLVFSPDGRWLAVTLGFGGVKMIETNNWTVVSADDDYKGISYGATFGPDGRLYTVADDGKIRRYASGPSFVKEAEVETSGGRHPASIAIDPNGEMIAVGFSDSKAVDFFDPISLRLERHVDSNGINAVNLKRVAWEATGQELAVGGAYYSGKNRSSILLFNRVGRRVGRPVPVASELVTDIEPCGSGLLVAADDPAFGLIDPTGRKMMWHDGVKAALESPSVGGPFSFQISKDAKLVRFGLGSTAPTLFDLKRSALISSPEVPVGLYSPIDKGLGLASWRNSPTFRLGGRSFNVGDAFAESLAIRSDFNGLVFGGTASLIAFDANGNTLWRRNASSGAIWGVNISADGRIVVATHSDGTIHWYRWSDGQDLLALFVNKDTKAWVAWTQSGYYSASPGGEDMIGWHVNRGWSQAADFFPASKFWDTYARPDIVEKVLDTLDEGEAIKQANAERGGKTAPGAPVTDSLPPVVSILSPADGASVGDEAHLDYLVRSPSGLPVDAVEALIDGRPASNGRGLGRLPDAEALRQCLHETHGAGLVDGALQGCKGSLDVRLPPGTSEVGIVARAGDRTSVVTKIRLTRGSAPSAAEILKPKLYALVVGISAYQNHDYALAYAAKDAHDFAAALQNQKGGLYSDVEVRSIEDDAATAKAIRQGLEWLTKAVTSRDLGLVYLAGHGVLDERERFYFLASDSDAQSPRSTAVPRDEISDALDALSGKALLFLDACHAGAMATSSGRRGLIDINTIVNDFAHTQSGVVVYAASTGRQVSQENAAWNNGAFTKAVVEGLGLPGIKGLADFAGSGEITTSELDAYVTQRVKALTGGEQSPVMIRPPTVPDFPLAVAR